MSPATLDASGIAARIPHHGRMCLLHALLSWSSDTILCSASSHADAHHPLRSASGLSSANGIEYAAQAMALHGVLSAPPGAAPQAGFLASVRGVRLLVPRLDQVAGELHIHAQRLAGDNTQAMYAFALHDAAGALLMDGRATVILNALP
jgi:predicted hotdog family 3-hydroxylacyl-ACP dehydratase